MGKVNQLWQEERERFATELVAAGMSEEDAWEYATSSCKRAQDEPPQEVHLGLTNIEAAWRRGDL